MFTSSLLVRHVPLDESPVLAARQQSAVFDDTYRENTAVVCHIHSLTDFVATYTHVYTFTHTKLSINTQTDTYQHIQISRAGWILKL